MRDPPAHPERVGALIGRARYNIVRKEADGESAVVEGRTMLYLATSQSALGESARWDWRTINTVIVTILESSNRVEKEQR